MALGMPQAVLFLRKPEPSYLLEVFDRDATVVSAQRFKSNRTRYNTGISRVWQTRPLKELIIDGAAATPPILVYLARDLENGVDCRIRPAVLIVRRIAVKALITLIA